MMFQLARPASGGLLGRVEFALHDPLIGHKTEEILQDQDQRKERKGEVLLEMLNRLSELRWKLPTFGVALLVRREIPTRFIVPL